MPLLLAAVFLSLDLPILPGQDAENITQTPALIPSPAPEVQASEPGPANAAAAADKAPPEQQESPASEVVAQPDPIPAAVAEPAGVPGLVENQEGDSLPKIKDNGGFFSEFPIKFSATLRTGYDSNIFYTRYDPIASPYTALGGLVDYAFGGRRLKLDLQLGGGISYYFSRPGKKQEYNGNVNFNLQYKVAPRIQLSISSMTQYLPQPSYSLVGGSTQYSYDYIYENTKIDIALQVSPKLSAVTSYSFLSFYYLQQTVNETQGYFTQTVAESLQFLLLPKSTVILEARAGPTSYFVAGQSSFDEYLLVGLNQVFNPRLKLTMRGGGEYTTNQNPISGQSTSLGPFFESHLSYNFGPASTLTWDVRYGTEASGVASVNQSLTFRTGLSAAHAFTPRLSMNMAVFITNSNYQQPAPSPAYSRNTGEFSLGGRFQINRQVAVELGYSYTSVVSKEQPSYDYTRQVIFIGGAFAL